MLGLAGFCARLLNFLREIYNSNEIQHRLPVYIRKDFLWWDTFLPLYNGISMMALVDWSEPDSILATDATLNGCGAVFGRIFPCVVSRIYSEKTSVYTSIRNAVYSVSLENVEQGTERSENCDLPATLSIGVLHVLIFCNAVSEKLVF